MTPRRTVPTSLILRSGKGIVLSPEVIPVQPYFDESPMTFRVAAVQWHRRIA
jgi:hypothetical protein